MPKTPGASDGRIVVKRKPRKCPRCGATPVARIVYGLVPWSQAIEDGRVVVGGCCMGPDMPSWRCIECNADIFKQESPDG